MIGAEFIDRAKRARLDGSQEFQRPVAFHVERNQLLDAAEGVVAAQRPLALAVETIETVEGAQQEDTVQRADIGAPGSAEAPLA